MRSEREKITGKVAAATLRLNANRYELPPDEDTCYLLLVSEGSVTLESGGQSVLVNPGSAVLLGPGGCRFAQTGSAVPQIVGCHFPLGMLHDLKNTAGRDFGRLFAPGERTVLYAPVQWQSRIRTLLEMMASASTEQDYPGPLYLLLILHYVEQECIAESSAVARPHNETVEQICAYLAANYRQKFSLTEVAAQFYLSPYYLSRLFRRASPSWITSTTAASKRPRSCWKRLSFPSVRWPSRPALPAPPISAGCSAR